MPRTEGAHHDNTHDAARARTEHAHTPDTTPTTPGGDRPPHQAAGHWLLARLGKRVLRPGGRETTRWLLERTPITGGRVVEFAPGLGVTARDILAQTPASYTGVDADEAAVALLRRTLTGPANPRIIHDDARRTGLPEASADAVVIEAVLSMQTDPHKLEILAEAARLLAPGGICAVHELGLVPDDLADATKTAIRQDLARSIRVNARPLTLREWGALAEQAGFEVLTSTAVPMALLEPRRLLADEGAAGTARILLNLARQPEIRRRVVGMRRTFRAHRRHLRGVGLILRKRA